MNSIIEAIPGLCVFLVVFIISYQLSAIRAEIRRQTNWLMEENEE